MQYLKDAVNAGCCYVVMPDQVMSWQGLTHFYLTISLVTFFVVISFYSVELTPVLPLSGNVLLALGAGLTVAGIYKSSRWPELSITKIFKRIRAHHD